MKLMNCLQESLDKTEQHSGTRIEQGLGRDHDNAATALEPARKRHLIEDDRRLGTEQGADYRVGKHPCINREFASDSLISEINNRNPKSKKRKTGQMATNSLYNHLQIPPNPRDRPSAISTNPNLGVNQKPKPSRCTARADRIRTFNPMKPKQRNTTSISEYVT